MQHNWQEKAVNVTIICIFVSKLKDEWSRPMTIIVQQINIYVSCEPSDWWDLEPFKVAPEEDWKFGDPEIA